MYRTPSQPPQQKRSGKSWEKLLLPHFDSASIVCGPKNSPTRLLVAALWLCLRQKCMNEGTAKEVCTLFNVSPKSLSNIMSDKRYTGGTARGMRKRSQTAAREDETLNHLLRSKRKAYKNYKSLRQQYVRRKTIVSPHIISTTLASPTTV